MHGKITHFLRRLPFLFKALFLTISVGVLVGMVTDYYVDQRVSDVFQNHLRRMLVLQSQENRLRFDHYLKNFYHVPKLTVKHGPFLDYLRERRWGGQNSKDISFKTRLPPWQLSVPN